MMSILAAVLTILTGVQEAENLQFKYWSGCKPGSWVKLKMVIDRGDLQAESEMTYTLLELKDDKAVVEASGKVKVGAQEMPIPVGRVEIKAADKSKIEKEGEEEIEVAGKKLKCRWVQFSNPDAKGRVWMSKDIPGGMAKGETAPTDAAVAKAMRTTALEWEKK